MLKKEAKRARPSHRPILCASLFFCLLLSNSLFSQETVPDIKVTLSARNRSINNLLDQLTLQTGYYFTYNSALISGKSRISLDVEDLPLNEVLKQMIGLDFSYRVVDRNIVIFKRNTQAPTPLSGEIERPMLHGRVVDARSGKGLPFASITLHGSSLGSISNQTGHFSFKLPASLPDPMLMVSFMGYETMLIPVAYPLGEAMLIRLKKKAIPIQEVIIRYTDPAHILEEALLRLPQNYLNEASSMTAFYRESVRRNDHCMVYSEAVLDVAKGAYNETRPDRVRIHKGRKITDYSQADTVVIKLRSGIYTSLNLDIIKNLPDFLEEGLLDRYDLEFTDLMTYGDKLVYVIHFKQKEQISDLLFQGKLYIDQARLAIVAADFEFNPNLLHRHPEFFLVSRSAHLHIRPVFARYHVDYRLAGSRYHISQVRAQLEMKVRRRRQWIGARYGIAIEMAITDVKPGEKRRIEAGERVRANTVLADQFFDFDPGFWGIYNVIEPEASLSESIKSIQQLLQGSRE